MKQAIQSNEIIIHYKGLLNFDVIAHLLNSLKDETDARNIPISHYKKILSVMIEILENIFKYNENFEHNNELFPLYYPNFTIEHNSEGYLISASNPILNKDIEKLSRHIDKINSLDKEGLRQLFRTTLTNGQFSSKGGAGLGFIEMAKISGDKIQYSFTEINQTFSYYTCIVFISNLIINQD